MSDLDKQVPSNGVVLMENLTKALIRNTDAQVALHKSIEGFSEEIADLREVLEGLGGISDELLGHLTTYLRILDHVAMSSLERTPRWKDVQEVLREIKDELQQSEAEAESEEAQEDGEQRSPSTGRELFPKKGKEG